MKILVLSHEFPPIGGGGGRVVQDLIQGLVLRKHEIHLITAHYGDLPLIEKKDHLIIERLQSLRTQPYRAGLLAMSCYIFKSTFKAINLARKWHPDLIHAHFALPAGVVATITSFFTGIPYMLTAHGGDVPGGAPEKTSRWFKIALPFSKLIWKKATIAVAVSPETRRLARQQYKVPIQVIPNGIDLDEFAPGDLSAHDPPEIIYIGRFSPEKNAAAVPDILAGLSDFPWHCTMLGDGPDMGIVQQKIKKYGFADRISLPGWVGQSAVKACLKKSGILLSPSFREGMPIAALQSLASGLALVLSRVGSCPDLVDSGKNGYLIDVNNNKGFRLALERLITTPELLEEFRRESRAKAAQFDIRHTLDAYETLFLQVITTKRTQE